MKIEVRSEKPGFGEVSIRDTGVGIPAGDLRRVFDRNFQVRRDESERPRGSGIGLAIVRDILRLHGCMIDVESEESRGTCFRFTLPLGDVVEESKVPSASRRVDPESVEAPQATPRSSDAPEISDAAEPKISSVGRRPRFRIIRRGS